MKEAARRTQKRFAGRGCLSKPYGVPPASCGRTGALFAGPQERLREPVRRVGEEHDVVGQDVHGLSLEEHVVEATAEDREGERQVQERAAPAQTTEPKR